MERSRHALLAIDAAVISLNREELDSTSSDTGSLHGARIIVTIDNLALLVRSELLGARISSSSGLACQLCPPRIPPTWPRRLLVGPRWQLW